MKIIARIFLMFSITILLVSCSKRGGDNAGDQSLMDRNDTIKHAYMTIKSNDPDAVRKNVYLNLDSFDAAVVSENWSEHGAGYNSGSLTIEVPSSQFLGLVEWLRKEYRVSSMSLSAREQNRHDAAEGNVANGIAYSEIYLNVKRTFGFGGSFVLGLFYAGEALKLSLQTITPVVFFLLPYAVFIIMVTFLAKFIKRKVNDRKK
ncbi:MAG: hypothetical protein JW982_01600 [Spirochaetes bacterium]|nr:hypothetical protein [Spirochaetota bacterium]